MSQERRQQGYVCENICQKYLHKKGYHLLYQNWTRIGAEIDLVLLKDSRLVFVEVRSRNYSSIETLDDLFPFKKRLNLQKSINLFMFYTTEFREVGWQVDLFCVLRGKSKKRVRVVHYKNVCLLDT